ncbi:hypothetical protein NLX86_06745 [Streptomyces sp. A3M-1-3]|nr:hypothetical protein [Streptomyces sp. A3M-1-3]MCP3817845.1 hypothetical protein [Streptomyces sp. A3M-1-3]
MPLSLFHVDNPQGDIDLVLSGVEAEQLHARLSLLLNSVNLSRVGAL